MHTNFMDSLYIHVNTNIRMCFYISGLHMVGTGMGPKARLVSRPGASHSGP